MDSVITPGQLGLLALLALLLFLAGRIIVLWYFKIDRAVDALEDIAASLRELPAVRDARARNGRNRPKAA